MCRPGGTRDLTLLIYASFPITAALKAEKKPRGGNGAAAPAPHLTEQVRETTSISQTVTVVISERSPVCPLK